MLVRLKTIIFFPPFVLHIHTRLPYTNSKPDFFFLSGCPFYGSLNPRLLFLTKHCASFFTTFSQTHANKPTFNKTKLHITISKLCRFISFRTKRKNKPQTWSYIEGYIKKQRFIKRLHTYTFATRKIPHTFIGYRGLMGNERGDKIVKPVMLMHPYIVIEL